MRPEEKAKLSAADAAAVDQLSTDCPEPTKAQKKKLGGFTIPWDKLLALVQKAPQIILLLQNLVKILESQDPPAPSVPEKGQLLGAKDAAGRQADLEDHLQKAFMACCELDRCPPDGDPDGDRPADPDCEPCDPEDDDCDPCDPEDDGDGKQKRGRKKK